jgi:hypothetical protein
MLWIVNAQITELIDHVRSNALRELCKQHQVVRATGGHAEPLSEGAQLPRQDAQLAWRGPVGRRMVLSLQVGLRLEGYGVGRPETSIFRECYLAG